MKKNKVISHTESLDDEITCLTAVKVSSASFLNSYQLNLFIL